MDPTNNLPFQIHEQFEIAKKDLHSYSPLTLAYLGDAVYEIIIRTMIVESKSGTVKSLHKYSSSLVNAKAQAELFAAIENELSEEEFCIYKRGRNAKSHSVAKNADIHDYRIATGVECLMGYLYLCGKTDRCLELIRNGLKIHSDCDAKRTDQIRKVPQKNVETEAPLHKKC